MSLYFCSKKGTSNKDISEEPIEIQDLIQEFYQVKELVCHGEQDSDGSESG